MAGNGDIFHAVDCSSEHGTWEYNYEYKQQREKKKTTAWGLMSARVSSL